MRNNHTLDLSVTFEGKMIKAHPALGTRTDGDITQACWHLFGSSQVKSWPEVVFSSRVWHWSPAQLSTDLQYIRAHQSVQVPWVYGCVAWQVVQGGSLWKEKLCCHGGKEKVLIVLMLCIALPWRIWRNAVTRVLWSIIQAFYIS